MNNKQAREYITISAYDGKDVLISCLICGVISLKVGITTLAMVDRGIEQHFKEKFHIDALATAEEKFYSV